MFKALAFKHIAYDKARAIAEGFRHKAQSENIDYNPHAVLLAQACAADAVALEILAISVDSTAPQKPSPETPK